MCKKMQDLEECFGVVNEWAAKYQARAPAKTKACWGKLSNLFLLRILFFCHDASACVPCVNLGSAGRPLCCCLRPSLGSLLLPGCCVEQAAHDLLQLLMLRRLKESVAQEMPSKLETLVSCPLGDRLTMMTKAS